MLLFCGLPIKHKLILLSVLVSGSALLIACAAFFAYDSWTSRDALVQTISTQARIVGANSAASLLFGDPRSATETLAALQAEPSILSAAIYIPDGKVFASYIRMSDSSDRDEEAKLPEISSKDSEGHRFEAGFLDLARPIIFQKEQIGIVAIRADLKVMRDRQLRFVWVAALVLLICTLGAIGVSLRFQHGISQPVLELAATAKRVSQDKDFSIRAKTGDRDELGLLIDTFNEMLGRIQEQNHELQQAHDELECRVVERTNQLEAANKELEAFSYSVSHDLRAPLRSIDGFSQALLEDYEDRLDEQGKDYVQRVRASTQRMGELIDDLLNLSRVSRGMMRLETVNLSAMAKNIIAELQKAQPQRQVEILIDGGMVAKGDRGLLHAALENLLGNAWKFTERRREAKIEFGVAQQNGKRDYFVRDNGAGFDAAYVDKLFGAFQRLHDAREFPGTGIGLATVKRIIHRHGGTVWAEGKPNEGATFYFTLPA